MNKLLFFLLTMATPLFMSGQQLEIYDVDLYETEAKDSFAFVSLSDKYQISEHPDSLPIPRSKNHLQTFKLEGKYRNLLLKNTKVNEKDNVYVYDYAKDKLQVFKVNQLEAVACLNYYTGIDEAPFPDYYYMLGFMIDKKLLKGSDTDFSNSLVYIGKESPFARGGIKPLVWKTITETEFPQRKITPENEKRIHHFDKKTYTLGDAWKSESGGFRYFVRDILVENRVYARWLLVYDIKLNSLVLDKMFVDSEGTMQAPLNYLDKEYPSVNQFAGKLFKDKPPVVFGFEYISYGCPGITFLVASEPELYINCDNRH